MNLSEQYITEKLQSAMQTATDSDGYAEIAINPETRLKCAAVLLPLTQVNGEWHLLFTRRTERVQSHKGQVSFPGGACDEGETTPEQTALREAEEEVGLRPADVKVLGRLSQLITVTSFRVSPIVGVIPWPYTFKVAGIEVARVFTIPLLWLSDRNNYWEFPFGGSDRSLIAYHPYDGELLWGATARMTVTFLKTIETLAKK
ncbi:MAG: CoA pyrophosphatase [Anaerolineales bacterium]|jgi:8-oxo-dGTP pyrophosphatase MutT (NUDIX family)|uniref:NUDIX hydrolase n=1 Tax=Candidatus Villigracilis affinis TaxID=3140682 RepID=UPI001E16422A|nr:CoA pyrophosphatase [Anaerolineales bacterium]MBK9603243.1 CoA pyrophosphatase [Anaerolineales bacterium]